MNPGAAPQGESSKLRPEKVKFMLMAANMGRAVRFYRDVVGFGEIFVSDFWSELSFGDAIIALHGGHDGAKNPTGLSLQFEDVFEAANRIEAGGAKIIESPRQREGEPILIGRFRDREGNEVYITEFVG
jgi:predicted enzyme related to lactoylglutathione lyase